MLVDERYHKPEVPFRETSTIHVVIAKSVNISPNPNGRITNSVMITPELLPPKVVSERNSEYLRLMRSATSSGDHRGIQRFGRGG